MAQTLHTCIIFYNESSHQKISKFRNVSENGLKRMDDWAKKHNVKTVNIYYKETKQFKEQRRY